MYSSTETLEEKYLRGVVADEIVNGYRYPTANDKINYTFHHNHLNSITALTGHTGTAEETWAYDAFGDPLTVATPGTGNSMQFTCREYDSEIGLYYYRARYYDSETGRVISEDPLGFEAGVNFYAYVLNNGHGPTWSINTQARSTTKHERNLVTYWVFHINPINFNDPMGKYAEITRSGKDGKKIGSCPTNALLNITLFLSEP